MSSILVDLWLKPEMKSKQTTRGKASIRRKRIKDLTVFTRAPNQSLVIYEGRGRERGSKKTLPTPYAHLTDGGKREQTDRHRQTYGGIGANSSTVLRQIGKSIQVGGRVTLRCCGLPLQPGVFYLAMPIRVCLACISWLSYVQTVPAAYIIPISVLNI